MIEFINVTKNYQDKIIFNSANLKIENNGLYILKGDNGAGKTTFYNLLTSFDDYNQGEIKINNEKVDKNTYDKYVYYYNVDFNLVDYLTIKDNLSFYNVEETKALVTEFGLSEQLNHKVSEISKGEKARVGIIKTLLSNKDIILLDEPFAYLDQQTSITVFNKLKEYAKNHIVIFSDHYFNSYQTEDINILNIENKTIKAILNNSKTNSEIVSNNAIFYNKNIAKLSFFIFFKHFFRSLLSCIAILISTTLLFTSLNFSFTPKANLYGEIIDHYDVLYGEVSKKDLDIFDINENQTYSLTNGDILIRKNIPGSHTYKNSAYLTKNNEITFENTYKFLNYGENKISLIVSNGFLKNNLINQTDELILSFSNIPSYLENDNIRCSIDGVIDEIKNDNLIFINSDNLLNLIKHKVFKVYPHQIGFTDIADKMNIETFNDAILSFYGGMDNLTSYSHNSNITNNEINLIVLKSYVDSFGESEFENYFENNIKNSILTSEESDNNQEFNLMSTINNLVVKGYKVIDDTKLLPYIGQSGIEISNKLSAQLSNIFNYNSVISPLSFTNIVPSRVLKNSTVCNHPMLVNHVSENKNVSIPYSDFNVLEAKDTYQVVFLTISLVLLLLSISFFYICSLNLIKENSRNFYALLKDSFSSKNIFTILSLGHLSLFSLSIILGLIISLPISNLLNLILESTTTLTFSINYFVFSGYNILILIAVILLIIILNIVSFYLMVYKKKINDLLSLN